jgi:hypothetical protein
MDEQEAERLAQEAEILAQEAARLAQEADIFAKSIEAKHAAEAAAAEETPE